MRRALPILLVLCGIAEARPAEPVLEDVRIELDARAAPGSPAPVERIFVSADVSPDTELLVVTIGDARGEHTVTTPPDQREIARPDVTLLPGPVAVTVTAVDHANQRSTTSSILMVEAQARHHVRCGTGGLVIFVLAPILALGLLLGVLVVIALRNGRTPKGPGEAVPLLVADHLARTVQRRATSWSIALGVLTVGAIASGQWFLLFLLICVWFVPLSSVLAARRVLRELDAERARAELRGTVMIVRSASGQARVAGSPRQISRARAAAVPRSTTL